MPKKYQENNDSYTDNNEDQSSIIVMLLTYIGLIAGAALICTIVWVTTHKTPRNNLQDLRLAEEDALDETDITDSLSGPEDASEEEMEEEVEPVSGDANMTFEAVSEDVTAKDAAFLRTLPNTDGVKSVVGQIKNGDTIKRVGINKETGWSKVIYNGQEAYAVTYMLTKDLDYTPEPPAKEENRVTTADGHIVIFKDCDDLVTAKELVNLRTEPSISQEDATIAEKLTNGSTARRTGISVDSGWARVQYNGEILYVVASYIEKYGQ